jgi:hypothetical protein
VDRLLDGYWVTVLVDAVLVSGSAAALSAK